MGVALGLGAAGQHGPDALEGALALAMFRVGLTSSGASVGYKSRSGGGLLGARRGSWGGGVRACRRRRGCVFRMGGPFPTTGDCSPGD